LRVAGGQVGSVGEAHRDPEAGQLVQHEDLVGVGAGEPVRGQAPHQLEQAGLGGVAQRVQAGPVQPGAGLAVVGILACSRSTCSWEPIVPRSACRSVDTRA